MINIITEISARHCHLSQEHLDILFGKGYQLSIRNHLSQPRQFAAEETVTVKTEKGSLENVRIVGPLRDKTQIEISASDSRLLGIKPPVRLSGDLHDSCGCQLVGPVSTIEITEGIIIPARHIHCDPKTALAWGLTNDQLVSIKTKGNKTLTFHDVVVRIAENFEPRFHIDTDEGNAAFQDGNIQESELLG